MLRSRARKLCHCSSFGIFLVTLGFVSMMKDLEQAVDVPTEKLLRKLCVLWEHQSALYSIVLCCENSAG